MSKDQETPEERFMRATMPSVAKGVVMGAVLMLLNYRLGLVMMGLAALFFVVGFVDYRMKRPEHSMVKRFPFIIEWSNIGLLIARRRRSP